MALPTPTVLGVVDGYIPQGVRRFLKVDTIADINAVTSAELTAGTDLTKLVAVAAGFTGSGNLVDLPNAGSTWVPKIPGLISADPSTLTLNMDKLGSDSLSLFHDGSDGVNAQTETHIVICYEGIVATGRLRVFPVRATSVKPSSDIAVGATHDVEFGIINPPSEFQTVPAA